MVKGDIIKYTHNDGREFLGIVRGRKRHRFVPVTLMLNRGYDDILQKRRIDWNTVFMAREERLQLIEPVHEFCQAGEHYDVNYALGS